MFSDLRRRGATFLLVLLLTACSDETETTKTPGDDGAPLPDGSGGGGGGGVACESKVEPPQHVTGTFCKTSIAGIDVVFVEPSSGNPNRLAVFFSGQSTDATQLRFGFAGGVDFAKENDLLLIALTDPKGANWAATKRTNEVKEVLNTFIDRYRLPRNNILFSGVDEGCHYLINKLIPAIGDQFQGAFHLSCGLYLPDIKEFAWSATDHSDLVKNFDLHFDVGADWSSFKHHTKDKITQHYLDKGFKVSPSEDPGRCENNPYVNRIRFWNKHITGDEYQRPQVTSISCDKELKSSVAGVKICSTILSDIEVVYAMPEPGSSPKQLAVFFHGDGGGAVQLRFGLIGAVQFAKDNNVLIIALTADAFKDTSSRGPISSWAKKNCVSGVREILLAFTSEYDLPTDKVLFSGASGGGWYLADEIIPTLGGEFQGAVHMICGANNPYDGNFTWDPSSRSDLRSKFTLYFDYGTEDFVKRSVEKSIEYYRTKGFSVITPNPLGNERHCGTDYGKNRIRFWSDHLVR